MSATTFGALPVGARFGIPGMDAVHEKTSPTAYRLVGFDGTTHGRAYAWSAWHEVRPVPSDACGQVYKYYRAGGVS